MVAAGILLVLLLVYTAWKIIVHLPQIIMWLVAVVAGLFALKWVIIILVGVSHCIEASASFLYSHGSLILLAFAMIAAVIVAIAMTCRYGKQEDTATLVLPPTTPPINAAVSPPRYPERVGYDQTRDFYSG
jgi:hypothetical protein